MNLLTEKQLELFKLAPYPFQQDAIIYHLKYGYSVCGMEMGLGKTPIAIGVSLISGYKTLVICPAFLKLNWEDEINKFSVKKQRIRVCMSTKDLAQTNPEDYDFIICNYEQLLVENMNKIFKWAESVVTDEAHYLKNIKAQRTIAFHHYLYTHLPYISLNLTGTPISGDVGDWYSLLMMCSYNPKGVNGISLLNVSYWDFQEKFSNKIKMRINDKNIVKFEGLKNVQGLKKILKGKYIRRLQSEVLDLPEMVTKEVIIDFVDVPGMEAEWKKFQEETLDECYMVKKARSAQVKAKYTVSYCKSLLESGENPLVIFTAHLDSLHIIYDGLLQAGYNVAEIKGGTDNNERHRIVTAFQAGKLDAIVCSIRAASVGLNLTRSRNVIFNDTENNPIYNAQALFRIKRIGQKCTTIAHFIMKGKFDRDMIRNLIKKIKTIKEAT